MSFPCLSLVFPSPLEGEGGPEPVEGPGEGADDTIGSTRLGGVALSLSKGRGGLPQGLLRHSHIPPLASEGERIETDVARPRPLLDPVFVHPVRKRLIVRQADQLTRRGLIAPSFAQRPAQVMSRYLGQQAGQVESVAQTAV